MRILSFLILLLLISANGFSNVGIDQFQKANQLYREGKYEEAIRIYDDIAKDQPSAAVYYNLGNAHFKNGDIGLAILNYERARNLKPRDRDILTNLNHAKQSLEYKIEDKRNFYSKTITHLLGSVNFQECLMLCFVAYFFFISAVLISLLLKNRILFQKISTWGLAFVIMCSLPLAIKYTEFRAGKRGIVTEKQTEVRYGPSTSDRLAFRLAEGLEVILDDEKEDWFRVRLRDGRSGWAEQTQISAI